MGLTAEDNIQRKNDERVQFIANNVCRNDSGKPYVFISYKSDDWEIVLREIVYTLVKEKGLNVYFDGDFNTHNSLWTEQFPLNMESANCRGVLAFVDDAYTKSYATLMELLYSQVGCQEEKPPYEHVRKTVVTINLRELTQVLDSENTGLGVKTYKDGKVNIHANDEKKLFDDLFEKAAELKILKNTIKPYKKAKKLSKELCAAMCREVLADIGANDNLYGAGITLDDIVEIIKDECGEDVFKNTVLNDSKKYKVTIRNDNESVLMIEEGNLISEPNPGMKDGFLFKGWFSKINGSEKKWNFKTDVVREDLELSAKWEEKPELPDPFMDGYTYTIFAKKYSAGKREQGKLMYDAFAALIERYPDLADRLTQKTSVARAEDVKYANTKDSDPTYFRSCKSFKVGDQEYLVGTSYGFKAKLAEIKGMFKICGADASEFILNGEPLAGTKKSDDSTEAGTASKDCFEYDLWNISHKANSLAGMIHDVFDFIAEKYPSYISVMADNESITSVARKSDVDEKKLPANKLNYFKTKKEHDVDGILYYVSTRYNREQGIGQLVKMLALCEGDSSAFKITALPDKTTHSVIGKKGLRESLNQ